jgi:hypothetical protein
MNITFNKTEILAALSAHVAATGISLRGKEVSLVGDDDIAIEVSINEATAPKTRKPRISKAAKNTVAEPTEEASTSEDSDSSEVDSIADEMEGKASKAPAKKTATRKKAPATNKKRMFGAAKK